MSRLVSSRFPHHGYSIGVGSLGGKQRIFSFTSKVFSFLDRVYAVLRACLETKFVSCQRELSR